MPLGILSLPSWQSSSAAGRIHTIWPDHMAWTDVSGRPELFGMNEARTGYNCTGTCVPVRIRRTTRHPLRGVPRGLRDFVPGCDLFWGGGRLAGLHTAFIIADFQIKYKSDFRSKRSGKGGGA